MIKRTIKETVREYDEIGKIMREIITETQEDDDTVYNTSYYTYPQNPPVASQCTNAN